MYSKDLVLVNQIVQILERIFEYSRIYENSDDFVADYKTFDATLMNFVA
jgi:uncharacterized protein with HEPN domain